MISHCIGPVIWAFFRDMICEEVVTFKTAVIVHQEISLNVTELWQVCEQDGTGSSAAQ